jgi:cell division protein FtsI/penicillin-binding protein 2
MLAKTIILIWGIIFVRLFLVAVVEHSRFTAAAERQHITNKEIIPQRGEIFAQNGEPLATNIIKYAVLVVPKNIKDKGEFAATVAPELGIPKDKLLEQINNDKLYIPPIKRGLSEEEAEKISRLNLVGLLVIPETYRFYPEGQLAAHLLGFVNAEGKGQYGAEGFYDDLLQGFKGAVSFERDPQGRAISLEEALAPARDGTDLLLTVDRNLQYIVEQYLDEATAKFRTEGGSVVVINPKTGEIIAMASRPAFDPGNYQTGGSNSLFLNPATQLSWEPGSVIKPLAMAAALNEGIVEPETTETFGSSVVVDGWTINTAQNKAFGRETMTQVLENSDNVGMVWVAEKLGSEKYYSYLKGFGFADKTGVDLQGEADPQILPAKEWRNINRATISFGQGIAITPLQLTVAYAALANQGKLMWPHLVKAYLTPDGQERKVDPKEVGQVISQETSKKITAMLVSVVERGHGKRARVSGYKVAGKTGTAQVPSPSGGYDENKHIGSFCGYAPAEDPIFAMCVKLDTPKNVDWAEASAAPVFGQIASWILANYNIRPTE